MRDNSSNSSSSSGVGFFSLLTILFVGLKLTEVITWSWWLVLLPAYGGVTLLIALVVILAVVNGGLK